MGWSRFDPHLPAPKVTEWSVELLAYGKFLAQIIDEWVNRDIRRFFIQRFDVTKSGLID